MPGWLLRSSGPPCSPRAVTSGGEHTPFFVSLPPLVAVVFDPRRLQGFPDSAMNSKELLSALI